MKIPRAVKGMRTGLRSLEGCLVLATTVALASCGGPAASSASGSQASTATPSPSADPANAAVLAAYRNATQAFVHAGVTMNPNDPLLPATMTGQELSTVKKNLLIDQASHLVAKGDITVTDAHVVSIDAGSAVVRDCQYSAILLVDARTGQGAPGVANGPQNIAVTATVTMIGGIWKVSLEDLKVGTCPLGY
jgi:hypothetical protein